MIATVETHTATTSGQTFTICTDSGTATPVPVHRCDCRNCRGIITYALPARAEPMPRNRHERRKAIALAGRAR